MFVALTHDYILFFTDKGKVYWLKVYDLPQATRTAGGRAIVNLLQLGDGERITGMIPVREFHADESLMMVTRRGTVKKTELTAFRRPLGRGIIALGLDENDQLIGVARTKAGDHVILSTRDGMAIRFDDSRVRSMGRQAYGVKGIDLADGDEVVGMVVAVGDDDPASLLTVCAKGYGKRTPLAEYRIQNRGGKGLIDIQTSERNGPVVAVAKVTDDDEIMLTTSGGLVIRTLVDAIRTIGRNTQGVRLIKLDEGDAVSSLAKLPKVELAEVEAAALEPTGDGRALGTGRAKAIDADGLVADSSALDDHHQPHIIDDGVAEAEASDHIDETEDDEDSTLGQE
jgi:DNA gyrase subunit A